MAELLGLDQLVANDQLVSNHDISSGKSQSQSSAACSSVDHDVSRGLVAVSVCD